MTSRAILALTTALALALPFTALAQAPEYQHPESVIHQVTAPADDPFDIAGSDLPFDPGYRVGVLDNGLRYIIRANATPAAQGMVYLWINAGSLGEEPDQSGFAHFLEHMAFNGSTRIPEGEMVHLLEREGLAFGPDTNASTTFDRTIYQLNLPRNDVALLDTALMLMRETASGLTLDPEAVRREIGVVQSELRVRDTYALRNTLAQLKFTYPGAAFAENWLGGSPESVGAATSDRLRDFYTRWYRPDNAAVVVIGDFDADAVAAAIRQHFANWSAPAPVEPPASAGPVDLARGGETQIWVDPALSEQIVINRSAPWIERPDTVATRRERVLREIGYSIVNRRLQRLQRTENPPFRGAGFTSEEVFHEARTTSLVIQAAEGEWPRGLAAAQDEYRRALEFGFTQGEVAEQLANLRASLEANAAGSATRNNGGLMTGAMTLLEDGQVPTTPESALERFNAHAPLITPEAVLAALKADAVPLDNPLIRFSGRAMPEGGETALRAAWEAGMAAPLVAREDAASGTFAYDDFGPAGAVVSDTVEPLLGVRTITFANGLKLNLKRTDLAADRVAVRLNIDGGEMLDTREQPLATAMTNSLIVGGLGAHTLDELVTILAGKQVGIGIDAGEETFQLASTTTPGDLDMQLRLFAAALSDPGYRPTGEEQYRRSVANFFAQLRATPDATLGNAIGAIVSDNDPRYSLQPLDAYQALTFAGLRSAIEDRWQHGAMELALVGDFDEAAAIDLVARTLGALPAREADFQPWTANRARTFTADRTPRVLYHQGEANQAMLQMLWPTRDGEDLREALELDLLGRVLRLQLTDSLREQLGQTYSPMADSDTSRVYPGWGTMTIGAAVTPADVEPARAAILQVVSDLRTTPVTADVLQRARAPLAETYENLLKSNNGWLGLVDRAQSQPDRLQRYTDGRRVLEELTPEDLRAMAVRYLDPAQRLEIVVLPEEPAAAE
ncbi:MAG: insulinase family protein [Alteraurantiacibacter sp.]